MESWLDMYDCKTAEREQLQIPVDVTYMGSKVMEIASAVCARQDAGVCKHKLERTGVLVIEEDTDE